MPRCHPSGPSEPLFCEILKFLQTWNSAEAGSIESPPRVPHSESTRRSLADRIPPEGVRPATNSSRRHRIGECRVPSQPGSIAAAFAISQTLPDATPQFTSRSTLSQVESAILGLTGQSGESRRTFDRQPHGPFPTPTAARRYSFQARF